MGSASLYRFHRIERRQHCEAILRDYKLALLALVFRFNYQTSVLSRAYKPNWVWNTIGALVDRHDLLRGCITPWERLFF